MKLVVIVLNNTEYLDDLLTAFLEIGVSGSTVIDSVGMGRILSHDVPVFAGLSSAFPGTGPCGRPGRTPHRRCRCHPRLPQQPRTHRHKIHTQSLRK